MCLSQVPLTFQKLNKNLRWWRTIQKTRGSLLLLKFITVRVPIKCAFLDSQFKIKDLEVFIAWHCNAILIKEKERFEKIHQTIQTSNILILYFKYIRSTFMLCLYSSNVIRWFNSRKQQSSLWNANINLLCFSTSCISFRYALLQLFLLIPITDTDYHSITFKICIPAGTFIEVFFR